MDGGSVARKSCTHQNPNVAGSIGQDIGRWADIALLDGIKAGTHLPWRDVVPP